MRHERHGMASCFSNELAHVAEHEHVCVDVDDGLVPGVEERVQEVKVSRRHRRLAVRVGEPKAVEFRDRELLRTKNLERLVCRIELPARVVGDGDHQGDVLGVTAKRLREDSRERHVVRRNGARDHRLVSTRLPAEPSDGTGEPFVHVVLEPTGAGDPSDERAAVAAQRVRKCPH